MIRTRSENEDRDSSRRMGRDGDSRKPQNSTDGPDIVANLHRTGGNQAMQAALGSAASPRSSQLVDKETDGPGRANTRARNLEGEEPEEEILVTNAENGTNEVSNPDSESESAVDDEEASDEETVTQPDVEIPSRIRSPTAVPGMPDRIPPRQNFSMPVQVTDWFPPMNPITIFVENTGGGNGSTTLDGGASVDVTSTTNVTLQGTNQTSPGNAGNLRLAAEWGGQTLAQSAGFSVAAIPQNFSVQFNSLITGASRGIRVENHWESDSGQAGDLDEVERSEQVEYTTQTGIFSSISPSHSGYLPAHNPPIHDRHSVNAGSLTGEGTLVGNQVFIFKDNRTDVQDLPVRNSGFQITREVVEDCTFLGLGCDREITTTKEGATVTANGYSSAAGSGRVSRTQDV